MILNNNHLKYKMLVLDLDDTLLRDDYTISERNKQLLMTVQEMGVKVVLASGRPTKAMTQFAEQLQLAAYHSFIVSFNGAVITDLQSNQVLFEKCLTIQEIHSLYDFSFDNKLDIITYTDKGVVSETMSKYIDVEINLTGLPHHRVPCFKSEMTKTAVKCILLEEPEYLKQMEIKLKAQRSDLSIARSKPFFLEVMPHNIDKAASIHFLAEKLNIKTDEIIAVGNAENDLSMVQFAGVGVWVDNVMPELRHLADDIVASNMNDGVAEVVEKYFLNGGCNL